MIIKRTISFRLVLSKEEEKLLNDTITLYSQAFQYCIDFAWEEKKTSMFDLQKLVYKDLDRFNISSNLKLTVIQKAAETIRSVAAILRKGKKASKPTGELIPVRFNVNTVSFRKNKELVSITTVAQRLIIPLLWFPYAEKYRDWSCKAGELAKTRKGDIILRLIFENEVEKPERTGHAVGFNRGIKHTIVSSDNRFIDNHYWTDKERRYLALRSRLQAKGTVSSRRHLRKLSRRIGNFNENCDRILAKQVCEGLVAGDTIVLEDIKNIRKKCGAKGKVHKKHSRKVGRWRFTRLATFIEHYADLHGIYVDRVKAVGISLMCSRCGMECTKNLKRPIQLYKCAGCGLKCQMDINAARNVVNKWRITNGATSGAPANRPIVSGSPS